MTQTNHKDFVPRMADIAREAGALLMEYFQRHVKVEVEDKGGSQLRSFDPRAHQEALAQSRYSRRRARPGRYWQRLSLVRGPARWHHELRARIPGILRFLGTGAQELKDCRRGV